MHGICNQFLKTIKRCTTLNRQAFLKAKYHPQIAADRKCTKPMWPWVLKFNKLYPINTIKQTSSNHPANALNIHVHDVRSNCSMLIV